MLTYDPKGFRIKNCYNFGLYHILALQPQDHFALFREVFSHAPQSTKNYFLPRRYGVSKLAAKQKKDLIKEVGVFDSPIDLF